MDGPSLLFVVFAVGVIGWLAARTRAAGFVHRNRAPALPAHHGWMMAAATAGPPLLFLAIWAAVSPVMVTNRVLSAPAAAALPAPGFDRAAVLSEARRLADGSQRGALHPLADRLAPAYTAAQTRYDWIATVVVILLAATGGTAGWRRVRPDWPARARMERLVATVLFTASAVAILTSVGIVSSLAWETARFFTIVPPADFLLGTAWNPQSIDPATPGSGFGALPLFWGTFLIGGVIAMAVAVPLGLLSAIYLSQYAAAATRRRVKPLLEVLAGIPSVVYGYIAALIVAPTVRDLAQAAGIASASSESALAAGLVMGVMIVPFVSSLSDDALNALSPDLRDGSLALGATAAETIRNVLLPAAMPGILAGVLLGFSRAIGETMIVVMAASSLATLTLDPLAPATTVTRQIADLLTGDAAFDSPHTLAAFALGSTLFLVTLALNLVAIRIARRHRTAHG